MWASVLICAALAALLALAVWGIVRRRKKMRGKCAGCDGCGGSFCGGCPYDGCGGSASRGGNDGGGGADGTVSGGGEGKVFDEFDL